LIKELAATIAAKWIFPKRKNLEFQHPLADEWIYLLVISDSFCSPTRQEYEIANSFPAKKQTPSGRPDGWSKRSG
jgi:hypothetical protein